jgi:M6 family metalloprotease-like protein
VKTRHLLILLLLASGLLHAGKLDLRKHPPVHPPRRHPHISQLRQGYNPKPDRKDSSFQKLLVILVDFQEEVTDDPLTTGNGKFLLQPDPSYEYSIGAPPHDRPYFLDNLEALRYYYLAVSNGSYNLEYEVFPQTGAYTLPHPMGYYNPPGAGSDLFVSRMEEYFKDAFELADSLSPEIDFSDYGNYMIIHAGSDWQHDIFADTPSDIPSFFITVGEGKEALVDGGTVLIDHACNVPSTISQDFYTSEADGNTYVSGYGALNAVIAHEYGHSIGFVDLYNVYNWQPMVGVFDIMDSGGSGILVDQLTDGRYVMVEGALPALPGAWSRSLVFGDDFKDRGLLKDLDQVELFSPLDLAAASHKQEGNAPNPQILRIPLSDTEYILVENRNVDPDNDGGTAVLTTPDSRVVLHPTALADPDNEPTYEYDYLLPSFIKADGTAIGGGILVWHIDDNVIYNQGVTLSDGSWVSNYDNNSVNRAYTNRGVEIIEADGLPDIGYDWSWYWTGTQYEYFHKFEPVLDGNGFFVSWSQTPWRPALSSTTDPALVDRQGFGSQYWLDAMGNPAAEMTVTARSGFFTGTQIESFDSDSFIPGPVINSSFSDRDLPIIGNGSITLLSNIGGQWIDQMGAFPWQEQPVDQPIVSSDQNANGIKELALAHGNVLELVEFSNDGLNSTLFNFPDNLATSPLSSGINLYASTGNSLSLIFENSVQTSVQLPDIRKLAYYDDHISVLSTDMLYFVDAATLQVGTQLELPETFGAYEPVTFQTLNSENRVSMLFLMADSGNVYRWQDGQLTKIFHNVDASLPTQLGLTWYPLQDGAVSPTVFWGCGTKIYALRYDGSLLPGFPYDASPLDFATGGHVYAIDSYPEVYLYFPVPGRGHVAYAYGEGIDWRISLTSDQEIEGDYLYLGPLDQESGVLYWYYADANGDLFIHSAVKSLLNNGIYWNGFRNGGRGVFESLVVENGQPPLSGFDAFVFPNPVRNDAFRVRIKDFTAELELDIYDIRAKLVQSHRIPADGHILRDVEVESAGLASGVYIMSIKCGDQKKRVKFAVEK